MVDRIIKFVGGYTKFVNEKGTFHSFPNFWSMSTWYADAAMEERKQREAARAAKRDQGEEDEEEDSHLPSPKRLNPGRGYLWKVC